jgi:hypothetical protein
MKTIIIATTIALATIASLGTASAGYDPYTSGYSGWAQQALSVDAR